MGGDPANDDEATDRGSDDLEENKLTPDVAFQILADRRDRLLCYLLYDRGGTTLLDELTTQLAAWEYDTTPDDLNDERTDHIRARIHHVSIPKLADHRIVTYDHASEAVTLTDRGEQLSPYLDVAKNHERDDVEAFLERTARNGS